MIWHCSIKSTCHASKGVSPPPPHTHIQIGDNQEGILSWEGGGSVVERQTLERKVGGSKPISAAVMQRCVLEQDTLLSESNCNTQEAVALS